GERGALPGWCAYECAAGGSVVAAPASTGLDTAAVSFTVAPSLAARRCGVPGGSGEDGVSSSHRPPSFACERGPVAAIVTRRRRSQAPAGGRWLVVDLGV